MTIHTITPDDLDYRLRALLKAVREYGLMKSRGQSIDRDGYVSQHHRSDAESLTRVMGDLVLQKAMWLYDGECRISTEARADLHDRVQATEARIVALEKRLAQLEAGGEE